MIVLYDSIINEIDCYKSTFVQTGVLVDKHFTYEPPHAFAGVILWWKWAVPEDILPILWSEWRTAKYCIS
jgi:hypothetical protein